MIGQLESEGLEPREELADWFEFVGGLTPNEPGQSRLLGVFDNHPLVSIEGALATRRLWLQTDPDDHVWAEDWPSWIPIADGKPTVVVELVDGPSRGGVLVLWPDEPWGEPQQRAPGLAPWIRQLTATAATEVTSHIPAGVALRQWVYFQVGSVELEPESASRLATTKIPTELFDRLVLRYPGPGVQPANRGRELEQVSVVEAVLRANGFADWPITVEPSDKAFPNPDLCEINIYGGFRPPTPS